jgi:Ca-activated chloride channel family protein
MKNLFYFITAAVTLFAAAAFVAPQTSMQEDLLSTTSLSGKISEADTGGPAFNASVKLSKGGNLVTGTITDFDGNYLFRNIDPGTYDVEVNYIGFSTEKISEVKILAEKENKLDFKLKSGVSLDEVVVTAYKAPLIQKDNTTQSAVITSESMRNVPTPHRSKEGKKRETRAERKKAKNQKTTINALSSTAAGLRTTKDKTAIRGSRSDATLYSVDGVSVQSSHPASYPPAPVSIQAPPPYATIAMDDEKSVATKGTSVKAVQDSINDFSAEQYDEIFENPFLEASKTPLSTFSIDVDAAAYSNMRRFLNNASLPPKDAVRIEEMVNYFNYDYPEPTGDHPFEIITEISDCPWQKGHKLLHVGLQGKGIADEDLPASNLVFLLDVSGSMGSPNKLPLLQQSLSLLVDNLRQQDFVSIVVYAGAAGVVLKPTNGTDKHTIKTALNKLRAGGSTAGGAGIELAYKLARENFVKKGNNRVILATDGDFNVGVSNDLALVKLIEKERESGVFLTVLGFGMGNYQDGKMQKLADKGNGNHAYIDNIGEAKKVLVNEFGGTLFTIAKDVKLQLDFNPAQVKGYRLIGYENRLLADEDFDDDTKDAGELGAGHTVTALYEIIPADYQTPYIVDADEATMKDIAVDPFSEKSNELVHIKFRYKAPDGKKSKLIEKGAIDHNIPLAKSSENFRWSAAVADFGLLLRDSKYKGRSNWNHLKRLAKSAQGADPNGYRKEMIQLVEDAEILSNAAVAGK